MKLLNTAVGAVPGGSSRPGQQEMVKAVDSAIRTGEHLLVQAGTGTGKSLGYLVPALLAEGPVVVSTATLALQSQLINGDLPRLAAAVEPLLGHKPTFALIKGRHHYLCRAKHSGPKRHFCAPTHSLAGMLTLRQATSSTPGSSSSRSPSVVVSAHSRMRCTC